MTRGHEEIDYYGVLGVTPGAKLRDITAAFHSLAKRYHPDTGHADSRMFKLLAQAYEVLSDQRKRREYDRQRSGVPASGASGLPADRPSRPAVVEVELPVTPEEARFGTSCQFVLSLDDRCGACRQDAAKRHGCPQCGGRGTVRRREPLSVEVPAGMAVPAVLCLPGKGRTSPSGLRGDLHVHVVVRPCW